MVLINQVHLLLVVRWQYFWIEHLHLQRVLKIHLKMFVSMTAYQAILNVSVNGIADGYPDGSYRPEQSVTRGQFSAFMARTLEPSFRTN